MGDKEEEAKRGGRQEAETKFPSLLNNLRTTVSLTRK
jgi:hypothetical protein